MNGQLPTSLRIGQPTGGRLSYSKYPTSTLEELLSGITGLAGTAEEIRKQRRQKALMDAITSGQALPGMAPPTGVPPEQQKSLLGKILGAITAPFNPMGPPTTPVPLEETIAETMLKHRLEPKTAKEKFEERFLAGEQLTDPQLQLIGAYIKPEKLPQDWETVKGDKNYWRINPETGEMAETKIPVPVTAKGKEPTTVSGALGLLKTYAGCDDNALQKVGVLGLVKAARNVVKRQPEYAQEIAMDVDDYFDEMIQKYNGNQMKAMDKVRKYMETLGVSQELILPYMRQR